MWLVWWYLWWTWWCRGGGGLGEVQAQNQGSNAKMLRTQSFINGGRLHYSISEGEPPLACGMRKGYSSLPLPGAIVPLIIGAPGVYIIGI
jgi:hypothetical protein